MGLEKESSLLTSAFAKLIKIFLTWLLFKFKLCITSMTFHSIRSVVKKVGSWLNTIRYSA